MNQIKRLPLEKLGFNFISERYIPEGVDEYFIRNKQHDELLGKRTYRGLSDSEIAILKALGNTADDWSNLKVVQGFNPHLVKNCDFYGLVRIGKLAPCFISFRNLKVPVGLYNSTICSSDIGDNVVVKDVGFIAHHIVGNEVILLSINELSISSEAKFGNGILKEEEEENTRIWLEIRNENGGRKVLPFEGMLPGDAYLWSKYRDDKELLARLVELTEQKFDKFRGHYGIIGDQCVIKYCKTVKDVHIGSHAYIKGANKLKNLTINSSDTERTQIGEGCELVNGIIGYGCRIFYGVKAVRFVMAPHSNLKYGARLINSYLGSNATISCCEVLNSLIFSSHEQHHNNSFLCAALVMGQSNLAAGATIGSNHNSRSADGELVAKRGFWPGLSVSLKHNSKFGSFSLIAKGDYPYEINLPFPFTLLIHDFSADRLVVMPGYWFMYNMYALSRNVWKFPHRDQRSEKIHLIEYDYLAPDTVQEMFDALRYMEKYTGRALAKDREEDLKGDALEIARGRDLLMNDPQSVRALKIYMEGIENSSRKVELIKLEKAYPIFRRMISYYGIREILKSFESGGIHSFDQLQESMRQAEDSIWLNFGGQLVTQTELQQLKTDIKSGDLDSWDAIHERYKVLGRGYTQKKLDHALISLLKIKDCSIEELTLPMLRNWLQEYKMTLDWTLAQVKSSRIKDYQNPFRKMTFDNDQEMDEVVGKYSDDSFIKVVEEQIRIDHTLADRFLSVL